MQNKAEGNLYFPTINMLRGIAALMVCIYHFTNYSAYNGSLLADGDLIKETGKLGTNGVFIFFVISGFVIPLSMFKGGYVIGRFHRFIARRWVRIEIPYIASILAFLVTSYITFWIYSWPFEFEPIRFLHHLTYTIPFSEYEWYNVIFWTLAIEFQFYLFIAIVFPLLNHGNRWVALVTIGLFAVGSLFIDSHNVLFHYGALFSMGLLLFMYKLERLQMGLTLITCLVFAILIGYANSIEIALFAFGTFLVISFITIDRKVLNKFGDISYSLYLTHGIIGGNILFFLYEEVESYASKLGLIAVAIVGSIVGSWVFWKFIEYPSMRWSKRIKI